MKYEIIYSNFNIDKNAGIIEDYHILLTGYKSSKLYPVILRLIECSNQKSGEQLAFISNIVDRLEIH